MSMKTYLDSESAKTAFTAVKIYTDDRLDNIPEATVSSAGLLSPSDKQKLEDTRFLGSFTLLKENWDTVSLSQVIDVPGAHNNKCMSMITPKTRLDANYWIDFGVYYDDTFQERDSMKFTCVELPNIDIQVNISSLATGVN